MYLLMLHSFHIAIQEKSRVKLRELANSNNNNINNSTLSMHVLDCVIFHSHTTCVINQLVQYESLQEIRSTKRSTPHDHPQELYSEVFDALPKGKSTKVVDKSM